MTEPGGRRRGTTSTTTREPSVRGARDAAERAADALSELIRHRVEGVSAVRRSEDDGWIVNVDVLEVARTPDTPWSSCCAGSWSAGGAPPRRGDAERGAGGGSARR
ncbi:gas vesicle protein GvpO [Streptomyces mutabilis]|uniref:gas vesicle protein GvpO n=1 Tax=Streptomyces mutabilis TaxID=67332 RepID=UPI001F48DA5E|nr:gas vesicle protein GvpO [Streptomyces mutabilis]